MITTLITDTARFTHIIHVGDIHIRLTKRHEEYREVFAKLFDEVKNSPPATLVVIVGDVVHNKTDLSPECVQLVKELLFTLAELRPTILIPGNHDTNLTNRNRLDSLSPIVNAINHPHLYYLKESGLFGFGNVCINNYSIFDSPDKYIKGEDIPKAYRNTYQNFVVLYHGPVDNSMTDIGFRIVNKSVTVSLFDHHDIALLGDIHMRQDLQAYDFDTDKPAVHYCGSLIQQNHGEALADHGFTLWNLEHKEHRCVNIPNDYGFFTVVMDKGQILTDLTTVPKKARIQFQLFETVATEVKTALTKLRESSEVIETSFSKLEGDASKRQAISPNGVVLGNISNRDYQVQLITDHLKNRLNVTDQAFIDQVIAVNDKTNGAIKKDDFARNIRWIPIRFEWDNMFSYGEGNVIDFTKMKDVVGLFAANASGKSTILSALTFCLFDKCEREFKAANILNVQKTTFRCKLEFEIDGKRYFIEREGKADRKGDVKVTVRFWTVENGQEVDLKGKERKDTNSIIRDYLGTYEDFILTSLSVQGGKNNGSVIDMGNTDRKDLLAQFMGLAVFDRLYNEANERFKELATLLKTYRNDDYTKLLVDLNNAVTQANSAFADESVKVQELTTQQTAVQQKIVEETKLLVKIEGNIPTVEESQKKKADVEKRRGLVQAEIEPTTKKTTELSTEIVQLEKVVAEYEGKKTSENYFKHQELTKKKVKLQNEWDKLVILATNEKKTLEKANAHQYDPNCKFCVVNSNSFIVEKQEAVTKLEQYKEKAAALKVQIEENLKAIEELEWTQEAVKIHQTSLAKLNADQTLKIRMLDRLSVIQKTLADLDNEAKECDKNIETYNKNKDSLAANEEVNKRIQAIKLELSNVETLLKAKNKTLMDLNGKVVTFKMQIDTINKKMEEAKKTEAEYKVYETYTQAVCRDGIPFNVITMTVPEIEREVNTILSQISEFSAKFETDGKNIIPYIVYDDKKWLMSLTSGMEKFTLSLAIRVALINISNLPRPNFLVIDEGFGVLDAENLATMQTLFSFLKSNFEFIMIVSHLEALRDMVDKQIEITKDNGFSKVNFA